jgi:hypothetical protein
VEIWLQKGSTKFQLPVLPPEYAVSGEQRNTTVNVLQIGDINLMGNAGLRELPLRSFFPAQDYNFSNNSGRKEPSAYVDIIEGWKASREPIRVIVTGVLNMECSIESFIWGERDATRDIYYDLRLKEYKRPKIVAVTKDPTATTSSARPVKPASTGKTYTVKAGDSLWKIAKQMYGNGAQYNKIFEANKDKIKNPNLIYAGQTFKIP